MNENAGDVASLIYLWNPLTIVTCLGSCTTPIDNFMVILTIYGACSRKLKALFPLFCKQLLNFTRLAFELENQRSSTTCIENYSIVLKGSLALSFLSLIFNISFWDFG